MTSETTHRESSRGDPPTPPFLEADQVRVEYGKLVAVRDLSFSLAGGDVLGLIGPNGAGKTSLLRVLAGLLPPISGTARVRGFDVFREGRQIRQEIGFAPDSPPAYEEISLQQFLKFIGLAYGLSGSEADERIGFWLEALWLVEKRDEKIRNLSRGMRQRVTLARTLIPNPSVILLDEPSSGLDPAGRIQLRQVFASLRDQGRTLIISSHILADLEEFCTHIAIIEHGRMLRFGRTHELTTAHAQKKFFRLTLDPVPDLAERMLAEIEGVLAVERRASEFILETTDSQIRGSDLLRRLVERKVPVASFLPMRDSLEETYMRSGVKQVD